MASRKKPQLSKSVLDMKFMKKSKERIEKEIENSQDLEGLYSDIITDEMRHATGNYISESSFIYCDDFVEGRLSFKGMNPEIEKLMALEPKRDEDMTEIKKDVSDQVLFRKFERFKKRKWMSNPSILNIKKKKK